MTRKKKKEESESWKVAKKQTYERGNRIGTAKKKTKIQIRRGSTNVAEQGRRESGNPAKDRRRKGKGGVAR